MASHYRPGGYPVSLFATLLGILAFGAGLAISHHLLTLAAPITAGVDLGEWQLAGWLWLDAHHVSATATVPGERAGGEFGSLSLIGKLTPTADLLRLFPLLLLSLAGVVSAASVPGDRVIPHILQGVLVLWGYLLALGVTVWYSTVDIRLVGGSVWVGPSLIESGLYAGLIYPLVCGTLGGLTVAVARRV